MVQKERQPLAKPLGQRSLILTAAMALATGTVAIYTVSRIRPFFKKSEPAPVQTAPAIVAVTGLGRLEPQGEVIVLSAPSSLQGSRVTELLVKEGDKVRKGQVVAILDSHETRLAALNQAKEDVELARARLTKVKAGAQKGEIAAQEATIARLRAQLQGETAAKQTTIVRVQAELRNAEQEYRRHQELYKEGAISASLYDSKRLPVETLQAQLKEAQVALNQAEETLQKQINEATATLDRISEVRPVDVQVSQAEVNGAMAAVERAQADLNLTYVRAPKDGQILKVNARLGETVGDQGIATLGQTDQMYAVAEIYETDIGKVRMGQRAIVTSDAFPEKLQGTVDQIGLQVDRQDVFSTNPLADTDQKIVEVKVRLNNLTERQQAAALTNLQVQVAIDI